MKGKNDWEFKETRASEGIMCGYVPNRMPESIGPNNFCSAAPVSEEILPKDFF